MEHTGDIYVLRSPSQKCYVGQTVCLLPSGKKHGYMKRWKQHVYEATNFKGFSTALDNAIRKYGKDSFTVVLLKTCPIAELDYWENYYIDELCSFHPNGYNLTTGKSNSRQSDITRERRRASMMGKNTGKELQKRERMREQDKDLPKYVRYYTDKNGKEGYRVSHHPLLKEKSFLGKTQTLDEKLQRALEYLNTGLTSIQMVQRVDDSRDTSYP